MLSPVNCSVGTDLGAVPLVAATVAGVLNIWTSSLQGVAGDLPVERSHGEMARDLFNQLF